VLSVSGTQYDSPMQLRARKPAPPLDLFIEKIWGFAGQPQPHGFERLLPDGSAELVINLNEDRSRIYDNDDYRQVRTFPGCVLSGPHSQYFVIDTEEQCSTVGVHFKPGGLFPFFGVPADEIRNTHVGLDALWGAFAGELRDRVLEAATDEARFDVVEAALLARAAGRFGIHPAVGYALGRFVRGPRTETISGVTERIGLSSRRFIQVFKEQVGLTPKLFCRVRRFQDAVGRIASGGRVEWAHVALDAGYFDQAHFINDFRDFSGLSPSAYAGLPVRHPNHVPLPG
jgi:AraC-like DNA-binding protein